MKLKRTKTVILATVIFDPQKCEITSDVIASWVRSNFIQYGATSAGIEIILSEEKEVEL